MKAFLFILTFLIGAGPLLAQPIHLNPHDLTIQLDKLKKEQQANQQEQIRQLHAQNERLTQELLQETLQNPTYWKNILWKDFLKENENGKGVERVSTGLDIECINAFCRITNGLDWMEELTQKGNSEPDYKTLLAGQKLIFIGEANNHGTKSAPLEVIKILRAVRKNNPQAKILLAAEFLVWENFEDIPTLPWILAEREENWENLDDARFEELTEMADRMRLSIFNTPLLKKAGTKTNLQILEGYENVFNEADNLAIDQLALDDLIMGLDNNGFLGVKVGEFVVWSSPQDKLPTWNALKKRKINYQQKRFFALEQAISISPWGVRERNREWARRISPLLPLYDIVLVYAGSGHLNTAHFMNLQPMLKQKNYMNILLYPLEDLAQEDETYYEQRFRTMENQNITQDQAVFDKEKKAWEKINKEFPLKEDIIQWDDEHKPLWIWTKGDEQSLKKMKETMDPQTRKRFEEEEERQKQVFPNGEPQAQLEVYLPPN